jgi:2-dehydro-3-deoxyphosphogluconate aldolase / (4S)-4-hydroxy-2-oxoglutarate aldolase
VTAAISADAAAEFFAAHLTRRVMVILRGTGPATVELCERAWSAGVELVEVPVQSEDDVVALRAAVAAGARQGRLVGAGTIVTTDLVDAVADAGAAFTVAPGLDPAIAVASRAHGLPHLPGVATPTDVQTGQRLNMPWQKAFPAAVLGPAWIRALRGPFPDVRFVATGGIDVNNARDFLAAGCRAVSLGASFADAPVDAVRALVAAT